MANSAKKLVKPSVDSNIQKREWTAIVQGRLIQVFADNQQEANQLIEHERIKVINASKSESIDKADNQDDDKAEKK